jgi:hypothetical protein
VGYVLNLTELSGFIPRFTVEFGFSEGVEVAQVFQKEVENPVVIAPPHALVSESVNKNRSSFMVYGVIIGVMACAGVVFIFFNREANTEIDPYILKGIHGRAIAFIAG